MFFVRIQLTCQYEKVVTETVDIGNNMGVNFCTFFGEGKNAAFCTSANRTAHMCDSCSFASSWENETTEGGKCGVDGVNFLFDTSHHLICHDGMVCPLASGGMGWLVISGEISAHNEKLVLNVSEELDVMVTYTFGDEQSDKGTEFVNGAIRFETCTSLADSLSTCEGCFPLIACSCVDFHRENELLEKVILFDTFFVENHHAPFPHVEGDDGAWVVDDEVPQVGILIVDVFDDENGVGGGR